MKILRGQIFLTHDKCLLRKTISSSIDESYSSKNNTLIEKTSPTKTINIKKMPFSLKERHIQRI
jgi:hypothetical protein